MDQSPQALLTRFRAVHAAAAFDVLDAMGFPDQALHHAIRPLAPQMRVAGPAYTARGMGGHGGAPAASIAFRMYREFAPGCVLVLDTGGHLVAGPWGENTSLSASMRGCTGAVIDGGTRDHEQIEAMAFPVFARFVTPVMAKGRWHRRSSAMWRGCCAARRRRTASPDGRLRRTLDMATNAAAPTARCSFPRLSEAIVARFRGAPSASVADANGRRAPR